MKSFFFSLTGKKKLKMKSLKMFLRFEIHFKLKKMKDYHDFYLECDVLLLGDFLNIQK